MHEQKLLYTKESTGGSGVGQQVQGNSPLSGQASGEFEKSDPERLLYLYCLLVGYGNWIDGEGEIKVYFRLE